MIINKKKFIIFIFSTIVVTISIVILCYIIEYYDTQLQEYFMKKEREQKVQFINNYINTNSNHQFTKKKFSKTLTLEEVYSELRENLLSDYLKKIQDKSNNNNDDKTTSTPIDIGNIYHNYNDLIEKNENDDKKFKKSLFEENKTIKQPILLNNNNQNNKQENKDVLKHVLNDEKMKKKEFIDKLVKISDYTDIEKMI